MIAFPRRVARRFRAACARCVSGRPRGPAPCVVIRQSKARVTLTATFPEVTLELACDIPAALSREEVLVASMTALEAVESTSEELVTFDPGKQLQGIARWGDSGLVPVAFLLPGKQHDPLPRPRVVKSLPAPFVTALHEASRTACRENGRFALSRVQVRGQKGQVIATDGKVAVIFSQFSFPFAEDLLIPAIPLFGCPELRDSKEVRVGRTTTHLVVSAGDWTAWLGIASTGKFPDVAGVIPRHSSTTVTLDQAEIAELVTRLPSLPGNDHEFRPVTLDAKGKLAIRAAEGDAAQDVRLDRSSVVGPAAQVVLDRRSLARMLTLGCRTLRINPERALIGEGNGVIFVAACLDPELAVTLESPSKSQTPPASSVPSTPPEKDHHVKPSETNNHPPNGRHDPPAESLDPLVAAEELRAVLAEAATKAARLVTALKQSKKEKKALANVFAGLKQLNLNAGDVR